ncbi:MAG TPA: YeeE/YedE thiosulfate transporter family protein [Bacteroidales bacterium]|nr:YeeE/YedE family protein [Lentimicrobiaceae bacterium]HOI00965.1 YeeE/YedE thiosulfate transporter family protein [Bacteroidales bacterium]
MISDQKKPYLNPYLGGFLLGLILLATFFITGRGLGASGAVKSAVVTTVDVVAPDHARESAYYSQFLSDDEHPLNNWLVFEVLGVLAGAFLSGLLAGRLKFKVEHAPRITSRVRLLAAAAGGMLFGFGSQLGRGCTSGAALSGMAVLSTAGFVTMLAIFGSGYIFAYFFRKLWI